MDIFLLSTTCTSLLRAKHLRKYPVFFNNCNRHRIYAQHDEVESNISDNGHLITLRPHQFYFTFSV